MKRKCAQTARNGSVRYPGQLLNSPSLPGHRYERITARHVPPNSNTLLHLCLHSSAACTDLVSLEEAEDVFNPSVVGQTLHPDQGGRLRQH